VHNSAQTAIPDPYRSRHRRKTKRAALLIAASLVALCACRLGSAKTPSVAATPSQVQPGTAMRVSGRDWRSGERVTIGLNLPGSQPQGSRPLTTALCDASGQFVALFSFPSDAALSSQTELWIWAYSADLARIAHASVSYAAVAAPTPTPTAILSPTPSSPAPTAQPTATLVLTQTVPVWKGQYYSNTTFSGGPALVRDDEVIDFRWGDNAPGSGLPADNFSVRWTGAWPFEAGNYRFFVELQDGVRMWLDGHIIIDQWHEGPGVLYSSDAYLDAAEHTLRVEYFSGRAFSSIRVWWEDLGPEAILTYPDWKAEYFPNVALSGAPYLVINERSPNFDWGTAAPAIGMPADNFSARWTRSVDLEAGIYRFQARADDGVLVWVNDWAVIDHWQDGAVQTYSGEVYLGRGSHAIRVEYYERTGQAVIQVGWERLPNTPTATATPTSAPPTQTPMPTATQAPPTQTPIPTATQVPSTATPPLPTPSPTPGLTPAPGAQSAFSVFLPQAFSLWSPAPLRIRRVPGHGPMP